MKKSKDIFKGKRINLDPEVDNKLKLITDFAILSIMILLLILLISWVNKTNMDREIVEFDKDVAGIEQDVRDYYKKEVWTARWDKVLKHSNEPMQEVIACLTYVSEMDKLVSKL